MAQTSMAQNWNDTAVRTQRPQGQEQAGLHEDQPRRPAGIEVGSPSPGPVAEKTAPVPTTAYSETGAAA